jgi:superfamily II DNA or RNA helicase
VIGESMKFYKHQEDFINLSPRKKGLWWEVGVGKTLAVLEVTRGLSGVKLIVCPKSLQDNWRRELLRLNLNINDYVIISKENFKKKFVVIKKKIVSCSLERFNTVIIDEAHWFFGQKSQLNRCLQWFIDNYKPEYLYCLSGTPYNGSNPWMIYNIMKVFGKNPDYVKFRSKFFEQPYWALRAKRFNVWVPKDDIDDDVKQILKHFGDFVKLSDCVDIPNSVFKYEYFDLTPEQKAKVKHIQATYPLHIQRFSKIYQVCQGCLKGEKPYEEDSILDSQKFDRCVELIKECDKLVVYCKHNLEIERLALRFLTEDKKVFIINGETKNVQEVCDEANKSNNCVVLINAAKSEGYNLGTFKLGVIYSHPFSLKDLIQMRGRIKRLDSDKEPRVYISLVVKDTIDEHVVCHMMKGKDDFQLELYEEG